MPTTVDAVRGTVAAAVEEEDVDDIFGDGVGSDYVCEPSAAQLARVEQERSDSTVQRDAAAGLVASAEAGLDAPPLSLDDDDDEGSPTTKGGHAGGRGNAATALLKRAIAGAGRGKRGAGERGAEVMEVVEEDDVSDEALLKASKTRKGSGAPPSTAGKDLMMGGGADDSYGEYFPDTFEGYSKALQLGPDEDDEQGIVRSKEAEEEDPGGAAGKRRAASGAGPTWRLSSKKRRRIVN